MNLLHLLTDYVTPQSSNNSGGTLSATILSANDLPISSTTSDDNDDDDDDEGDSSSNSEGAQSHVSMIVLDTEVKTGPPSARHKERNSFKFVEDGGNRRSRGNAPNTLVIMAPLSDLYQETATFHVLLSSSGGGDNSTSLTASCQLNSTTLHINQPKCLILHLQQQPTMEAPPSSTIITTDEAEYPPTLRLKLTLSGSYRPEIAALIGMSQTWFSLMDILFYSLSPILTPFVSRARNLKTVLLKYTKILPTTTLTKKTTLLLILASTIIGILPLLIGLLLLIGILPFLLPLLLLLLITTLTLLTITTLFYLTSPTGRTTATHTLKPYYQTIASTPIGQQLLYQTGPRPSPVTLARVILPTDPLGQLLVSLLIDSIGSSSYLLPGIGEAFDLVWAPIQTILLMALYDDEVPILKYISFVEELLPFTDVVPSGLLGWGMVYGPLVWEEGVKKWAEWGVVVRGER